MIRKQKPPPKNISTDEGPLLESPKGESNCEERPTSASLCLPITPKSVHKAISIISSQAAHIVEEVAEGTAKVAIKASVGPEGIVAAGALRTRRTFYPFL